MNFKYSILLFTMLLAGCSKENTPESNNDSGGLPTVTIANFSNITPNSATGGGNVIEEGSSSVTAKGLCWSTAPNPDINDNRTNEGGGGGAFNSDLSNLIPETLYYARAYATNGIGTSYSGELELLTESTCMGVLQGNVTLSTQAQVDDFGSNNYCEITDRLDITQVGSNDPIVDLSPLSSLTKVSRLIVVGTMALTDLNGLKNLRIVEEEIVISANETLQNIEGLNGVNSPVGRLIVVDNESLRNIDGFSGISSLTYPTPFASIRIENNAQLQNINGLVNVNNAGGGIVISNNDLLTNIDALGNLTSGGEFVEISGNEQLMNLDGLSNLSRSLTTLEVSNNPQLQNLNALSGITNISLDLIVDSSPQLSNLNGLNNIVTVGQFLTITNNEVLLNIDALSNLSQVNFHLIISQNDALTNLNGLTNLTTVIGDLEIGNNFQLTDLCGLNTLIVGDGLNGSFDVFGNGYNPTEQDILDGNCSL